MTPTQAKLLAEYRQHAAAEAEWLQLRADASAERCKVVAAMNASGMSYAAIAAQIGLSRSRVQVMVESGRTDP